MSIEIHFCLIFHIRRQLVGEWVCARACECVCMHSTHTYTHAHQIPGITISYSAAKSRQEDQSGWMCLMEHSIFLIYLTDRCDLKEFFPEKTFVCWRAFRETATYRGVVVGRPESCMHPLCELERLLTCLWFCTVNFGSRIKFKLHEIIQTSSRDIFVQVRRMWYDLELFWCQRWAAFVLLLLPPSINAFLFKGPISCKCDLPMFSNNNL